MFIFIILLFHTCSIANILPDHLKSRGNFSIFVVILKNDQLFIQSVLKLIDFSLLLFLTFCSFLKLTGILLILIQYLLCFAKRLKNMLRMVVGEKMTNRSFPSIR